MNAAQQKFLTRLAIVFVATFLVSWVIVTIVPACVLIALATYGACTSLNWLAIMVMIIAWSLIIAVVVATVIHWHDRL